MPIDPLTGLGDRADFDDALSAARAHQSVAIVLADIDGFTAFNERRGAKAADRVLVGAAAAMSNVLRRSDTLYRTAGDEFAALVHVYGAADAFQTARRLRSAAAETGQITVSVAVAAPFEHESDAALLGRTRRTLETVRAAGADGIELAR